MGFKELLDSCEINFPMLANGRLFRYVWYLRIKKSVARAEVCAILKALQPPECCTVFSDCQCAEHLNLWDVVDALMSKRPPGRFFFL